MGSAASALTKHSGVPETTEVSTATYDLTDPQALAAFLTAADIRLVRAAYLYKLRAENRKLPRRQEAEEEFLVTHEEVKVWADEASKVPVQRAMICSISHCWETREHPDPCGYQLQQMVNTISLYEAAYVSELWIFYDYVSLFQFQRETEEEEQSFRSSMADMHVMYAHECTWTFRIEHLTPEIQWQRMLESKEDQVEVYNDDSKTVKPRPLQELVLNRNNYQDRGWCRAEISWSSVRSRTSQNLCIDDAEATVATNELQGRVAVAPAIFKDRMTNAAFTHRSDADSVIYLQNKVFHEKVEVCQVAVLQNLPKGEINTFAEALPHYKQLQVLKLLNFQCTSEGATNFAQALTSGENNTELRSLEIRANDMESGSCMIQAISAALRTLATNSTVKELILAENQLNDQDGKALASALEKTSGLRRLNLRQNCLGDVAAKALAEVLEKHPTLRYLDLGSNLIYAPGMEALASMMEKNQSITTLLLDSNRSAFEGAKAEAAIQRGLERNRQVMQADEVIASFATEALLLQHWRLYKMRIEALAFALLKTPALTTLSLHSDVDLDGLQAIALALERNTTVCHVDLSGVKGAEVVASALARNVTVNHVDFSNVHMSIKGAETLATMLEKNSSVLTLKLAENDLENEGVQALAKLLTSETSQLTDLDLTKTKLGVLGVQALSTALASNSTLLTLKIAHNHVGDEGAKALAVALETNATMTELDLEMTGLGLVGVQALAASLEKNSTLRKMNLGLIDLGGFAGAEAYASLQRALSRNCGEGSTFGW
eukprot:symbB.v1.2.011488.t1/scaffold768.1/size164025/1